MFIPVVSHTTVINKNIEYSDTVLPLKDLGANLKVTSISNVEEYSLESCLKTILEENPNVTFNTIQYSKSEKKVYFYTNAEISKKNWEDSKANIYRPLTSSSEILEEVKRILTSEKNKDSNCISLYDIANLMKKTRHDYEVTKKNYESKFEDMIRARFGYSSSIIIYRIDYNNSELEIGFKRGYGDDYDEINFSKRDDDIYISSSESCWDKEVLAVLGNKLLKLHDELMKYRDFFIQYNYGFKSLNSNFLIDVDQNEVSIFTKSQSNPFLKDFEISSSKEDEYSHDCNSSKVINALQGNEDEIFKKIFVRIDDCPKWSRQSLYEIRQKQLAEEQEAENKQRYIERKKQKRLELKRKLFPFLKK